MQAGVSTRSVLVIRGLDVTTVTIGLDAIVQSNFLDAVALSLFSARQPRFLRLAALCETNVVSLAD
jgi:hypothetical protein